MTRTCRTNLAAAGTTVFWLRKLRRFGIGPVCKASLNSWSPQYVDALILRDENTDQDDTCDDDRDYSLADANLNVTALVNTSGTAMERYLYTPYGEVMVLDSDFSSDPDGKSDYNNTTLYTGRTFDPAIELYDYRHRVYHAQLGRFASRDPVGIADGFNIYRYLHNDSACRLDPTGLGEIKVEFSPANISEMGWIKRFKWGGPPGGYPGFTHKKITVNCWYDLPVGPMERWDSCVDCLIDAHFWIEIWYVHAISRLGFQDIPFQPHPVKTIEGIYGHEQRHVKNWKEFLMSLEQEFPMDGFAGNNTHPQAIEDYLWDKIKEFGKEEAAHEHIPPQNGILYCPLKGKGTMPPPDWNPGIDVP